MQTFYMKEINIVEKKKNRFKKSVEKLKGYSASKINPLRAKRYTYKMFQMLFCTKQCQNIKKIKLKEDVSVYNYFNKKISGNKELIFFIEYSSFSCLVRKNLVHPVHSFVTFISSDIH